MKALAYKMSFSYFSETLVTTHLYEGSMETKDDKQFTDRQVI
jgi:hypothetical protein